MTKHPTLQRWLQHADADHFFRPGAHPLPPGVYDAMEELLVALEGAHPVGLPGKRLAFAKQATEQILTLRSELLAATLLIRGGIDVTFPAFPDIAIQQPFTAGVEVTTRRTDDTRDLELYLAELQAKTIPFAWELHGHPEVIPSTDRREIEHDVAQAVANQAQLDKRYLAGALRIVLRPGDVRDITMDAAEWRHDVARAIESAVQELQPVIDDKRRQVARHALQARPLVLLVDMSQFGFFGSQAVWGWVDSPKRLAQEMAKLAVDPFDAILLVVSNLEVNAFAGALHLAPGVTMTPELASIVHGLIP